MFLTFEQQDDLVKQGLAKRSDNARLSTFKYARKVMYDYLWNKHPELLECRGHTYDNVTGELIIAAPRKTFNYLENGTWADKPLNTKVSAYKKYNGFMACAAYDSKGEVVISTTGSTKSDYAEWAKQSISPDSMINDWTHLYEIVIPQDPHIVQEDTSGAIYLGSRNIETGRFIPSLGTCEWSVYTLADAIELCKTDRGEGFMLYDEQDNCCKMKTEYYIGKKKLMRMSKSRVESMYNSRFDLPNLWAFAPEVITRTFNQEEWIEKTDQERRVFLEAIGG